DARQAPGAHGGPAVAIGLVDGPGGPERRATIQALAHPIGTKTAVGGPPGSLHEARDFVSVVEADPVTHEHARVHGALALLICAGTSRATDAVPERPGELPGAPEENVLAVGGRAAGDGVVFGFAA